MKLLVTQLQHQDPTQPQSDTEFMAQLAQFSSLDRLTHIQQSLDTISQFVTSLQSATTVSSSGSGAAASTTMEGEG
jgi:flagellar basal-body rod modification protein FlgD